MSTVSLPPTIVIDNVEYDTAKLSNDVKDLIMLHVSVSEDINKTRIRLAKEEAAREMIGLRIAGADKSNAVVQRIDTQATPENIAPIASAKPAKSKKQPKSKQ